MLPIIQPLVPWVIGGVIFRLAYWKKYPFFQARGSLGEKKAGFLSELSKNRPHFVQPFFSRPFLPLSMSLREEIKKDDLNERQSLTII